MRTTWQSLGGRLAVVASFAMAMALLEAVVVAYIRGLIHIGSFAWNKTPP